MAWADTLTPALFSWERERGKAGHVPRPSYAPIACAKTMYSGMVKIASTVVKQTDRVA